MHRLLLLFTIVFSIFAEPTHVTFINPGGKGDPFFQKLTDFMTLAAEDVNIELEVLYCERNHIQIEHEIKNLLKSEEKPDYLLVINEKNAIAPYLEAIDSAGIPFYLFNEGLLDEDHAIYGHPGDSLKSWIGELLPNDYIAGKLLCHTLLKDEKDSALSVIGLAGVMATSSSITREQGFQDALSEYPNAVLKQIVPAFHDREKAKFMIQGLQDRYKKIDVIWAASDIMALGALDVMGTSKNVLIGGIDWSDEAYELVKAGKLKATIGGHFLDGARVILQIAAHSEGQTLPNSMQLSGFGVITKENHKRYAPFFNEISNWKSVDFSSLKTKSISPSGISVDDFLKLYSTTSK